ncbi:MAG: hypothetical protein OEW72_04075 [Gammaproteobacteria bacterium]|nr:hypothetical protein [Gammaproteobacteria bacterium]
MLIKKSSEPVVSLAGQAAQEIRDNAVTPLLNRAADRAGALVSRSAKAVREGSRQARASARQASVSTATYVRDEPVKSMLLAAATGAALLALVNLLARSRDRE